MKSDPKHFWDLINKLNDSNCNKKDSINEKINSHEFTQFFKNLNIPSNKNSAFHDSILSNLNSLIENYTANPSNIEFNSPISEEEIVKVVKSLKNGKASASDFISNEMIKYGISVLLKPLQKLFNLIFSNGKFPESWSESIVTLIHKKGSKYDPNNYRGISITSNLGKLFNKILYNRLLKFVNEHGLICENQIGFKESSRTSDHIFTLKSIIDHYKAQKKKVFASFIDLRKAFDTVWREGLFHKLIKAEIPSKLFQIIYSMYIDTKCKIKFSSGITKEFPSTCGVKQGDVLSPLLFNLYINDLVKSLEKVGCNPVVVNGLSINSLLYADDIILLSDSEEGLQKSLDCLEEFCSNWKLNVNHEKSKVMVFNSNGETYMNNFQYGKNALETVKSFCYLGVTIKYNGNINASSSLLMEKGRKAFFKIKKCVGFDNPCSLLEKLFDSLISPIILYCSELWGVDLPLKDSDPYEYLHLKFIKEILGVHYKSTNVACRAELNRLPLKAKIQCSALKFLEHILSSNNTLINKIYFATEDTNSWTKKNKDIVSKLGFYHVQTNPVLQIHAYINHMQTRINDQILQEEDSAIFNSSKLDFYKHLYKIQTRASYVDILSHKSDRSALAKLRVSAHKLNIEYGRYAKKSRQDRVCIVCSTASVESEVHFLLECPAYTREREEFFYKINKLWNRTSFSSNFIARNRFQLFNLFNDNNLQSLKLFIKYVRNISDIRENLK